ncbi:glycosyltransferase family 2 protein [Maribacter sp. 2-571]|uniref:glycosyltransferase family 2 protein n=1 Tax=Maribacter sp. 2-571 TaxID=3417569 RepID=UPI003D34EFDF
MALVSIVTPVYNSERYIEETISSVRAQTYEHWEHILVDDCSTDSSESLIKALQKQDDRIKYFRLEKNGGAAISRNKGISMAKGDYLTFLDADDIWFPEFITKSISALKKNNVTFVFSSYKRFDENLTPLLKDFIVPEKVRYDDILKSNSISCLTAFLDIKIMGKKYMPLIRKRQDMGLWISYLKEIDYALGIQEPLAIYRIRKDSLSRDKKKLLKSQWYFYSKVEKLGFFTSIYYMVHWMIRGFLKYQG